MHKKSPEMTHFQVFTRLGEVSATGIARDEKDEKKRLQTKVIGCIIDAGQESNTEIRFGSVLHRRKREELQSP
jgi:hypothetical protein